MTAQKSPQEVAAATFPLDGSDPSTVFECRRRLVAVLIEDRSRRDEVCDVRPGGRPCENSKPDHALHWSNGPSRIDLADAGGAPEAPSDEQVERAGRAMFEDPNVPAEYTWAQMVEEDPSRADIWREDARRVLTAAGIAPQEPSEQRPYSEDIDHEHATWEVDALEERAHDLLAVVRHRRAVERLGGGGR